MDRLPFLDDDFHFAIAHVAARSAQLDVQIEMAITILLHKDAETAAFLLKSLSADRVVDLLAALLRDRFPADISESSKLIQLIKASRSTRNDIIHRIASQPDENGEAMFHVIRPFRSQKAAKHTAASIRAVAADMLNCTRSLVVWMELAHRQRTGSPKPST